MASELSGAGDTIMRYVSWTLTCAHGPRNGTSLYGIMRYMRVIKRYLLLSLYLLVISVPARFTVPARQFDFERAAVAGRPEQHGLLLQ